MFDIFNQLVTEMMSFYDLDRNNANGVIKKGHSHRHEKDTTLFGINSNYNRKHLNLVPKYTIKSNDAATEKIRSLNYDNNTSAIIDKFEAMRILKTYNINPENLYKKGYARLGRSKTIIKYNPMYGNFTLIKKIEKDDE